MLRKWIIALSVMLMPAIAHAGKGAQVDIRNGYGQQVRWEFRAEKGLSSDSSLKSARSGTVTPKARDRIAYVEEAKWSSTSKVRLRLMGNASDPDAEVELEASGGAWKAKVIDPDRSQLPVLLDVQSGDQDTILVTVLSKPYALGDWMGALAARNPSVASRTVNRFALLGTHDSATYNRKVRSFIFDHPTDTFTVTQTSSIADQLAAGVRFLDLRLGWRNGRVEMYHGSEALDLTFDAAARQIDDFLAHHGSEFVLVSLKMDDGPHEDIRNWIVAHKSDAAFARFRWDTKVPTYAAAKGQAVVLDRGIGRGGIALDVPDNAAYAFDDTTNVAAQDLYKKFAVTTGTKSEAFFDFYRRCMRLVADRDARCDGRWILNFASASNYGTPREYAGAINPSLLDDDFARQDWVGVLIIDSFDAEELKRIGRNTTATYFF